MASDNVLMVAMLIPKDFQKAMEYFCMVCEITYQMFSFIPYFRLLVFGILVTFNSFMGSFLEFFSPILQFIFSKFCLFNFFLLDQNKAIVLEIKSRSNCQISQQRHLFRLFRTHLKIIEQKNKLNQIWSK